MQFSQCTHSVFAMCLLIKILAFGSKSLLFIAFENEFLLPWGNMKVGDDHLLGNHSLLEHSSSESVKVPSFGLRLYVNHCYAQLIYNCNCIVTNNKPGTLGWCSSPK